MPLRVAQVCPYSLSLPGGVQGQVLGLAAALRQLGHEARVLAPCDAPPPDPTVTALGKSVPLAANGSVAPIAPDPACLLRTLAALADEEFDIVHLHEPLVPGPTLTALALGHAPMVGTFHRAGESNAYRVLRPVVRRLSARLSVRCAVSRDARVTAQAALAGEYRLVFNGIDVARFAKARLRPTDGPTVLFLGRHEPRKGLAVLLEAMADLPADVHLWVAGDGRETDQLQRRFAGDARVEWLGRVSDQEASSLMRSADVFCAPSLHGESFGIVLLEAMAAQTPVVASDLPGYRAVARPDEQALLVPPGDARALAAGIRRVLDDGSLRRQLMEAGELRAAELSMDRLAERYVEIYESALAR